MIFTLIVLDFFFFTHVVGIFYLFKQAGLIINIHLRSGFFFFTHVVGMFYLFKQAGLIISIHLLLLCI